MQFLIYVVKTKIRPWNRNAKKQLETVRHNLIKIFGGLMIAKNLKGFWMNDNGKLETDKVDLWIILKKTGDLETETASIAIIEYFSKKIKTITKQNSQLFQINLDPFFV